MTNTHKFQPGELVQINTAVCGLERDQVYTVGVPGTTGFQIVEKPGFYWPEEWFERAAEEADPR